MPGRYLAMASPEYDIATAYDGAAFRLRRRRAGLTVEDIAVASGRNAGTIYKIEQGRPVRQGTVDAIEAALMRLTAKSRQGG